MSVKSKKQKIDNAGGEEIQPKQKKVKAKNQADAGYGSGEFSLDWDVDSYRTEYESEEHWDLRRSFMLAHKEKFEEDRLVCLAQTFINMEFMGCKYPSETMRLVAEMSKEIAEGVGHGLRGGGLGLGQGFLTELGMKITHLQHHNEEEQANGDVDLKAGHHHTAAAQLPQQVD